MKPSDPTHRITLVAMPPSGEVFLARDGNGVLWLIPPRGAGRPEPVDEEIVERAVVDHGFDLIEESFDTWEMLDADRQRRAGEELTPAQVDFSHFDGEDVRRLVRALARARDRGQVSRARRFAHRLLDAPVVRGDHTLLDRIVSFLRELDDIPVPAPPTVTREPAPERSAAHERVHDLLAA
jgi:hypothetical protein